MPDGLTMWSSGRWLGGLVCPCPPPPATAPTALRSSFPWASVNTHPHWRGQRAGRGEGAWLGWGISWGKKLMSDPDRQRGVCLGLASGADRGAERRRRMKPLPLVLCWGLLALAGATPVPLQNRALEMVLDEFHNKTHIHFFFKQQAVVESVETLQAGTFVQLEVDLVQTACKKSQRGMQNCWIKPGGRKQKCLACFKFDSSENVLDKSVRCLSQQVPFFQVARKKQEQECQQVRLEGEEHYRPGVFAFSRGLPMGSG